jgi:hypothetical protein
MLIARSRDQLSGARPASFGHACPPSGRLGHLRTCRRELTRGTRDADGARMTERTPLFDTEEIELLFSEAEDRPATSATAELRGAFAADLPRGVEVATIDAEVAMLRAGDDDLPVLEVELDCLDDSVPRPAESAAPSATAPGAQTTAVPRGTSTMPSRGATPPRSRDYPTRFSPNHTMMASAENMRLALAFDHLELELARLGTRWDSHAPRSRIEAITRDFAAFMRILLEDVELEPIYSRSAETSMLVHDTYVRLITVAGVLREAMEGKWANAADIASAYAHAEATLDAFTPFVGLADRAMRRICLEAETLEGALRWLSRQLDEEAAERLRAAEAFVPRRRVGSRFRDN